MEFARGSEWRRWDLHVHTPQTKKNDQYAGSTIEEKWERFYTAIHDYVGDGKRMERDIAVIGIADYLSVDNYLKVVADGRLPQSVKLVLPNVEMRIVPLAAKEPINIHFIFDPAYVEQLEQKFFSRLMLQYNDTTYSATRQGLISLGRVTCGGDLPDEQAYLVGIDQFVVTLTDLQNVFSRDKDLRAHTLIGIVNGTNDGASGLGKHIDYKDGMGLSQLTTQRQALYQFADFIFSGNPNDREYFLGKRSDSADEVIRKCHSLMPCVHGSDAHCIEKLFEPDQQRYCWIKADPTFNGLRQILYEPEARVQLSSTRPQEKNSYHVIDHVTIEAEGFSAEPVLFSDQLTCIIGGKSTGKSLLLHNMAYAVDHEQVKKRIATSETRTKDVSGVCVHWRDGTKSTGGDADTQHSLVYIPQSYLNRLSESSEEVTDIDRIIQDIILQHPEVLKQYEVMRGHIEAIKQIAQEQILGVQRRHEALEKIRKKVSELGNREGIEKEIARLNEKKELLTTGALLTPAEIESYTRALSSVSQGEKRRTELEYDITCVQSTSSVVERKRDLPPVSQDSMGAYTAAVRRVIEQADNIWLSIREELVAELNTALTVTNERLAEQVRIRDDLRPKVDENEALRQITTAINEEVQKLREIVALEAQQKEQEEALSSLITQLAKSFLEYYEAHAKYVEFLNGYGELNIDDLEFKARSPFRTAAFCEKMSAMLDNRKRKQNAEYIDLDEFDIAQFTEAKICSFIHACISGKIAFARGNTSESVLRVFLTDWYNITYDVTMDHDTIGEMSPGKKALVLLKLLISMQNSRCPILIDQPEDDLDNRSIFSDLIPFIRKKKIDRQIIVVTHNANVVVGGDAECVIVANQNAANVQDGRSRFEYRSGSIEDDRLPLDEHGVRIDGILHSRSIQQHICDILEGGVQAFDLRKQKYRI